MRFTAHASAAVTMSLAFAATATHCCCGMPEVMAQVKGKLGQPALAAAPRTWHVAPEELAGLTLDAQVRTISEAVAKAAPGDTVLIHGGVYRETVTVEKSGTKERPIRLEAASGEHVVISGADVVRAWKKEPGGNNVFSTPWKHRFIGWNKTGTHPDDDEHRMIGRCEQVFVRGYSLLQVLDRSGLGRGTFYEISYGLHAHDNVITGNGFAETPGSWGAGGGVVLSSSPDCLIERNLIVGNREGFNFREQGRKTPRIDDEHELWIWNHDERISHNVFALNRDAQVWGWFDVDDNRHLPASLQNVGGQAKSKATGDLAAAFRATDQVVRAGGIELGEAGHHL